MCIHINSTQFDLNCFCTHVHCNRAQKLGAVPVGWQLPHVLNQFQGGDRGDAKMEVCVDKVVGFADAWHVCM